MSAEELAALLTFATLMSFTPGPNTTMSTALAANHGLRRTLRFIVAVPTGWTLMMLACGLGLGALVLAVPALNLFVRTVGIGYLLWMAWRLAGARTLAQADGSREELAQLREYRAVDGTTAQPRSATEPDK